MTRGANRNTSEINGDSTLGNLIADAQLVFAKKRGAADVAMINSGGIRANLTVEAGRPTTISDLYAILPFNNELIVMTLSGAQLREVVSKQLPKTLGSARFVQVSGNFRFQWSQSAAGASRLDTISMDGRPLQDDKDYRVVVNNFMAEGGDDLSVFRQGRDKVNLGVDLDALVEWLAKDARALDQIQLGRIVRVQVN